MTYRTESDWNKAIARLKPGLHIAQVAAKLGRGYCYTRLKLDGKYEFRRKPRSTDHSHDRLKPNQVDWSKPNIVIARELGVSREYVRLARAKAGKPKVNGRKPDSPPPTDKP